MRRAAQLLAVLCVAALVATAAVAGGRKPPGGEDPSTGGGTIYFQFSGQVWTMNSDGSDKTTLPVYEQEDPFLRHEPSRQLHDGHRWFLTLQEVGTYGPRPDGSLVQRPRYELFAVSDDGITEPQQLTFSENLEKMHHPYWGWTYRLRWAFDDSRVSWIARRWDDPLTGSVVEGGIYSLAIDFSDSTPQPVGSPTLVVPGDLLYLDEYRGTIPLVCGHDWSPDGESIVYTRCADGSSVLSVADATGPSASWDLTEGSDPEWSPDGTTIAFVHGRECWTIGPDGQDQELILAKTDKKNSWDIMRNPSWSPTASHLACTHETIAWSPNHADVLRVGADGSHQTNLTRDLNTKRLGLYAALLGWR